MFATADRYSQQTNKLWQKNRRLVWTVRVLPCGTILFPHPKDT